MNRTTIEDLRTRRLDAMTTAERTEFNEALTTARLMIEMSEKIRAARRAAGLSRSELAERISTSRAEVESIETGSADATLATLLKAATALGLKLDINPAHINPAPAR